VARNSLAATEPEAGTGPDPAADTAPGAATQRALTGLFGRDALYVAVMACQIVLAALVTPFITRLLPRDQFGLVASATALMQVLFVLCALGLGTAIQRQHAQGRRVDARKLLSVAIASSTLVSLLVHLTGPAWSEALGFPAYGPFLWLTVTWAGASAIATCSLALIRSQDRLGRFVVVALTQSVGAELAALALLLAASSPDAEHYVLGKTAAQLVAVALGVAFAVPVRPRRADRQMIRQSLRFSLPLVPMALSTFVLAAGDRLILQRVLGPDAVGAYQVAYNIGSVPILLLGLLSTSWLPRLFSLTAERGHVLAASRDAVYRLLLPVVIGMAVAGPVILRVWAPESYHPDALAMTLAVVVVCIVPEAAAAASTRTLLTLGRSNAVALGTALAAVVNILLNFALIPVLGLVGSALATFLSLGLLWAFVHAAAHRTLALAPPPRGVIIRLWVCVLAAVASALVPVGGVFLGVRLLVGVLAFGWLVAVARRVRGDAAA
jgi:O-antigen/teichoic acid export membrane protein